MNTTAQPFHNVLLKRIKVLDVTQPTSVQIAMRLREDATETKIPANKILEIQHELRSKMIEVTGADSTYVNQVHQELTQASVGVQTQIDGYRARGDLDDELSGEITGNDDADLFDPKSKGRVSSAVADKALGGVRHANGHATAS